jgi:hypothetical protein
LPRAWHWNLRVACSVSSPSSLARHVPFGSELCRLPRPTPSAPAHTTSADAMRVGLASAVSTPTPHARGTRLVAWRACGVPLTRLGTDATRDRHSTNGVARLCADATRDRHRQGQTGRLASVPTRDRQGDSHLSQRGTDRATRICPNECSYLIALAGLWRLDRALPMAQSSPRAPARYRPPPTHPAGLPGPQHRMFMVGHASNQWGIPVLVTRNSFARHAMTVAEPCLTDSDVSGHDSMVNCTLRATQNMLCKWICIDATVAVTGGMPSRFWRGHGSWLDSQLSSRLLAGFSTVVK